MNCVSRDPNYAALSDVVTNAINLYMARPLKDVIYFSLECVYPVEAPRPQAVRQQAAHRTTEHDFDNRETAVSTDVVTRIATLEAKIENMGSSLQRIESYLVSLVEKSRNQEDSTLQPTPTQVDSSPGIGFANSDEGNRSIQESQTGDNSRGIYGPPDDVFMEIIDSYFTYCQNQPYSFFHEDNFRRSLSEEAIPKHLILAMMATAVRFCSNPYFNNRALEMSVEYANRSWKLIVSDCFTVGKEAEVSAVQTVALLGLFDFTAGRSRHGSAWVKVGLAVRMAQDCGLMLENATHLSHAEQEERRRVFWSVYLLDRLVSCGRGRPPAIVDASCHVQLPCDDSIWREGLWVKTQSLDEMMDRTLSVAQRQGPLAQVIAISHVLGRCAQYVLQDFNIRGPHPPWDPGSDFAGIESDLLHLEAYLEVQKPISEMIQPHISADGVVDSQTTGPIIFSRALFHLCYCLLNHPFLLQRRIDTCRNLAPISFIQRSSDLAWSHAQQMMSLIREVRKLGCSFHSSSSGYAVTVAGSIIALQSFNEQSIASPQAQILLEEVLLYLDIIGQYWSNVRTMASTLRRIVYNGFTGSHINSPMQSMNLMPAEEEAIWAVVDYNTMSNQVGDDVAMSGQTSDGTTFNSWVDLFGPIDYSLLSDINMTSQE
ncbi:hypothetical protein FGRA07_03701 [Fusarium graminearum]|nr:hypothetical protein FGRA07_03701 [Fusarium graminearum]